MLLEADKIYQGTSQINLGTGPGRPWCRYATAHIHWNSNIACNLIIDWNKTTSYVYKAIAPTLTPITCNVWEN